MPAASPLAERVAGFIAEHGVLQPGEPVVALVSGGADSLCLWGLLRELGYEVEALHTEHGLRGEAGLADAAFCAGLGATVVPLDLDQGPNLEARARAARYAAAEEHAAGRPIATGHTLTDQAETVVYRLASSSGVRALSAMRPRAGQVARPLLCATGAETREWCRAAGLVPRVDDTNSDTRLRRNLIRREVMPALRRVHPAADANIARTAELLAELDELLAELAVEHVAEELDLDRLAELPRPLRAIVLRIAAERAAGRPLRLTRALTEKLVELAGRADGVERLSLGRDLEATRDRRTLTFNLPHATRYPLEP
jgi:tRNA(Ile)-lysidine synthase